jgi:hypothetical protein
VEMSERLLLIPCANSLELCLSQAHWHRKLWRPRIFHTMLQDCLSKLWPDSS